MIAAKKYYCSDNRRRGAVHSSMFAFFVVVCFVLLSLSRGIDKVWLVVFDWHGRVFASILPYAFLFGRTRCLLYHCTMSKCWLPVRAPTLSISLSPPPLSLTSGSVLFRGSPFSL